MASEWRRGSENGDESHGTTERFDLTEEEIRRKQIWCEDLKKQPVGRSPAC